MKTNLKVACALLISVLSVSCSNSDDNSSGSTNITFSELTAAITANGWVVSIFEEDGVNQTSNFAGYTFTFNTDGTVTATNGSITVNGSWAYGTDDSKAKLILNFGVADPWEEIGEDWRIVSISATTISLTHVSGGDGSVDNLVFIKP